jgi:polar amino acid transport system substrate-binding protein
MRRRGLALVSILAVFALVGAACGEDTPTGTGGTTTSPGAQIPQFTTIEEGVLTVASCLDYDPFEYVEGGDEKGFDVDLSEEIAERLGLEVKWVKVVFETSFTALDGGQFDMIAAAVTATGADGKERDEVVDFSDFYFNAQQSLTVNTEQTPDIKSTDDLGEGDTVGVQRGTTGQTWAEDNLSPQGVEIKTFAEAPAAFTDLEAGNITGVVNDEQSTVAIIEERPSLAIVQRMDTNEKYALAISEDNPELREAVNLVLAEIIADGTYERLFNEYFPGFEIPEEYAPA